METKKKGFPAAFWVCACTEIFERLAYYLGRSLILIFVTASVATGGLGLSDTVAGCQYAVKPDRIFLSASTVWGSDRR